ncbi:helix-turn-helix domain-containing protein [Galbibacter sp. EGI 63066]|uniref:helix-turn-helix domain-containing protein n=1 Tax=Galbibacter sp. EGI 63066 TaxID=2993559 RepID=UPI002248D2AC|nr:helix-turn-helix domain-containing protein [Galbibacter sp. EGI 63066]MCX2678898.1 helix-turn-helix domain-containing protein [Galbibacter sp. EGI 63066]
MRIIIYISTLLFFTIIKSHAQKKIDSLDQISEDALVDLFYSTESNPTIAIKYANAYLKRAESNEDPAKVLNGYYFIAEVSESKLKLKYADSIITFSKEKHIHNSFYPFLGYLIKADESFAIRDFKKSIDNYLNAKNSIIKDEQNYRSKEVSINYRIGLLKSRLGHYDEALAIFKNVYKFYSDKKSDSYNSEYYLMGLFALSDGYLRTGKLDSSRIFNKKGLIETKMLGNNNYRQYFIFNEGLAAYKQKNYEASIDSLHKTLEFLKNKNDIPNLSEAYYYLGMSHIRLTDESIGINYFLKIDSIFSEIGDLHPDLRNTYEALILYYQKKDDKTSQLRYLNQLLKADSIISSNYQYLSRRIDKDYDTPKIIQEKNQLINDLQSLYDGYSKTTYFLVFLIALIVIILFREIRKMKTYKSRYQLLLEKNGIAEQSKKTFGSSKKNKIDDGHGLPKNIVDSIINKLNDFEAENKFTDPRITLNSLARELNSNSTYLSKVINHIKGHSFTDYINDLRISYSVSKLNHESNFRKYTIKAIAKECGFRSAETYSKRFYDTHGIYPSYFIKQLEKDKIKS